MNIKRAFESRAVVRGGLVLFHPQDAVELIRLCRETGVDILGIDSFTVVPEGVQPSMEHSVDFTVDPHVEPRSRFARAEQFIRERESLGLLFEIVIPGETVTTDE